MLRVFKSAAALMTILALAACSTLTAPVEEVQDEAQTTTYMAKQSYVDPEEEGGGSTPPVVEDPDDTDQAPGNGGGKNNKK